MKGENSMARRSRADMAAQREREELQATQSKLFSVGIYARLSIENSNRPENNEVITTQIDFCKNFVAEQIDMDLVQIYSDNGATGTNFNRDGFLNLIRDLELGVIDAVVVRDFSRLGRNRMECLRYLTKVFPDLGVRFVAINDFYDSLTADETSLEVLIKNIMNEYYSHDISRKLSTALRTMMENGTFRKRLLPYGYMWNENKEEIVLDEGVSHYVKMMFQWKLENMSLFQIAEKLDELKAPIPRVRNRQLKNPQHQEETEKYWHGKTIQLILLNPHYTGDLILGRTEMALYKGIHTHVPTVESQWVVFPNNHPALVSKEDFERIKNQNKENVQAMKQSMKDTEKERSKQIDLFDRKIFCGDCGRRMYFIRAKHKRRKKDCNDHTWVLCYTCSTYRNRKKPTCTPHTIQQKTLNELVLEAIKMQIKVGLDYEKLLNTLKDSTKDKSLREKQNAHISSLRLKINGIRQRNSRLYKDYVEGILTLEEYNFTKETYQQEIDTYSLRLEEAKKRKEAFDEAMTSDNKWISLVKSISRTRKLNQSLVDMAIHKILVYEDGSVELVMNYHDIFLDMTKGVEEVENEVVE